MDLRPKKSLGQHFLNSETALEKIVSAAHLSESGIVLEIGPGTGALTSALLDTGATVTAIEKDDRACALLSERFSKELALGRLRLIHGDILKVDRRTLGFENGNHTVVANIPYYITGAIFERVLEHEPRPYRMVLLVQKEVADRIAAKDGKESVLSVSVKAFGTVRIVTKVPKGSFLPPPKVDSAIITVENISDKTFLDRKLPIDAFFKIVKAGFAHKRKYLARNLESVMTKSSIETAFEKLKLDKKARAEDVPVDSWFKIAECA